MHVSNNKDNIDWTNVVKKEVIGTDGLDLGEVVEIGDNFIVVQKGIIEQKKVHNTDFNYREFRW